MSKAKNVSTLFSSSEIDKVKAYVEKHGAPRNLRFEASLQEVFSIAEGMPAIEGLSLIFAYGKAKGYRQAKAEGRART